MLTGAVTHVADTSVRDVTNETEGEEHPLQRHRSRRSGIGSVSPIPSHAILTVL